jgi:hypothetical protein
LHRVLFDGDIVSKQDLDLKANYKLNYDVPKLSSYQQVREENKSKTKQGVSASDASTADDSKLPSIKGQENTKVVITGDDVLIEYVSRLINKLDAMTTSQLNKYQNECIEKFISHYVWHNEDVTGGNFCERLHNRLNEMILRRKKLLKSMCKKEVLSSNPNSKDALALIPMMIEEREGQKSSLLENFTIGYLEEMLKSTTKSIARDVVNTLIESETAGVLLSLEKRKKTVTTKNSNDLTQEEEKVAKPLTQTQQPYKSKSIIDGYKNSQSSNKIPVKNQTATNWKSMERSSSLKKAPDTGVKFPPATMVKKPKAVFKKDSKILSSEKDLSDTNS